MRKIFLIIALGAGMLLGFAMAGCRTTEPEPTMPVLRPRQLPLASDMIILDDQEPTPGIAF